MKLLQRFILLSEGLGNRGGCAQEYQLQDLYIQRDGRGLIDLKKTSVLQGGLSGNTQKAFRRQLQPF